MQEVKEYGHKVDPKTKRDKDWILGIIKPLVHGGCMANQSKAFMPMASHYNTMRLYAIGKQSTANFRRMYQIDGANDLTTASLDYTPTKVHLKYRDIAIAKILQRIYDPVATPVDMEAKDKNNEAFIKLKTKLATRKILEKSMPEMASHPMLQPKEQEPQDLDELEMRFRFGEQFGRSMDSELMISLGFYLNEVEQKLRKPLAEDWFDFGLAGYKDGLDANNLPTVRRCDPRNIITSNCHKPDFSDATFWGEMIIENLENVFAVANFNEDEKQDIRDTAGRIHTGTHMPGISFGELSKGQVRVLDMEFLSTDSYKYEMEVDKYGNLRTNRREWDKTGKHLITKEKQVVYKCKWIVGTDHIYDYGPAQNQKRKYNKKECANVCMSFRFFAYNFHDMEVTSYMERMIPIIDDFQRCKLKLQNMWNNYVSNGFAIDMDALESASIAQDGKPLGKKPILELFRQRGILLYRGSGLTTNNPNAKPIVALENHISGEVEMIFSQMGMLIQELKESIGLNEITDASTPNERTLNGVASYADQSTNNALWPLINVDKIMMVTLAKDMDMRIKQSIMYNGAYEGYMPSINETTLKLVKNSAEYHLSDHAIMMDMRPTRDERQYVISLMQQDMVAGRITYAEVFTILHTNNLKQSEMILSYRIERNRKRMEDQQQQNQMMNIEGQKQSGIAVEQAAQQTMTIEYQLKIELENAKHANKMEELRLSLSMAGETTEKGHLSKLAGTAMQVKAKMGLDGETGEGEPLPEELMQ